MFFLLITCLLNLIVQVISDGLVIDTHVHNTNLSLFNYLYPSKWPDLAAHDWTMSDYFNATAGVPTTFYAILMELEKVDANPDNGFEEAQFFQSIGEKYPIDRHSINDGVMGFVASSVMSFGADVTTAYIQKLQSETPLFKGIRQTFIGNDTLFTDEAFLAGIGVLENKKIPLDLMVSASQLDLVYGLAKQFSKLKMNINHIGWPNITGDSFDQDWANSMSRLAGCSNVYVKLSGLPMAYGSESWTEDDFTPYVKFIVEHFSPKRINFAGNWFVLNEFGDYVNMFNTLMDIMGQKLVMKIFDVIRILAGTALEFYDIKV